MNTVHELPREGFIRIKQVLTFFPVSRSTWYEGIKKGVYPKPIKLSVKTSAWDVNDIRELIARVRTNTKQGAVQSVRRSNK